MDNIEKKHKIIKIVVILKKEGEREEQKQNLNDEHIIIARQTSKNHL